MPPIELAPLPTAPVPVVESAPREIPPALRVDWGCVFAETIVITDDGARRMHSFSTDFQELPI